MENKQKIIIFEGPDKTGKSTLLYKLNKKNNYYYWVLDRSVISCIVYDKLFNREHNENLDKILEELDNAFDLRIIYCKASDEDMIKRLILHNEQLPLTLQNFDNVRNVFEEVLKRCKNVLTLNTSLNDIESCLNQIEEFIK